MSLHRFSPLVFLLLASLPGQVSIALAQESSERVRLFLDCPSCDDGFIRAELTVVDYVRDQQDASVHLLITRQGTAGGGAAYELQFIGKRGLEGMNNQLFFNSRPNESPDKVRRGLLKIIRIGLAPYLARTGMDQSLDVVISEATVPVTSTQPEQDPWHHWIFQVHANGNVNLESLRRSYAFRTGVNADHVTELWRVRFQAYSNFNRTLVEGDDETFVSERLNQGTWGTVAYSLSDHWSVGAGTSYFRDTYQNIDHHVSVAPALEYSFFPYREVMRRELTMAYRLRALYQDYSELTVYDETREGLAQQELQLNLRILQPWGQVSTGLSGAHFLHDFSKFRSSLDTNVDLRLFRGLAFRMSANFRLIRDQLSLPAGGSSLEDLLLQQRQLATNYEMGLYAGVSYTFGSMYNNVVNTRL